MQVPRLLVCGVGWGFATLMGTGLAGWAALAQDAEPPAPPTLRVYTDLLQIPVLVLDDARRPVIGLAPNQFRLSVDSGRLFQAPYVRREGEDPLALTVLLDEEGLGAAMEAQLAFAVGALAERSLAPRDRVTVAVLNGCAVSQTGPFAVTTPAALRAKVATVLNAQDAATSGAACGGPLRLRDVMAKACVELEKEEGRRVLLVLTSGVDGGSKISWRELRHVATTRSVAIFAVSVPAVAPRTWERAAAAGWGTAEPEALAALCDLTGGVLIRSDAAGMKGRMDEVVQMVRERYILEFERPAHLDVGGHDLAVKVSRSHTTVRGGGISFPPVKAEERNTTETAPNRGTRSPEPGTRRILDGPPPAQ